MDGLGMFGYLKFCLLLAMVALGSCSLLDQDISINDKRSILIDIIRMEGERKNRSAQFVLSVSHDSNYGISEGKENYERSISESYARMDEMGFESIEFRIGRVSGIYESGDEELVIVPRESIFEMGDCRWFSVTYIAAIRHKNSKKWKYFFASGLQGRTETFWDIFPEADRGIELPPNYIERL